MTPEEMEQHFERKPGGHIRWVSSRELHERGLISDEVYAQRVAAMEALAVQLREAARDE